MVVLHGKAYIAQAISLEKFCGTNQSAKTMKLLSTSNNLQYMVCQKYHDTAIHHYM